MPDFTGKDTLVGARFSDVNLKGSRFVRTDLSGAVMRGVDLVGTDIDSPWLFDGEGALLVNGVDVVPFVDAELNRRWPGRELRRASDPPGLRAAWAALQAAWGSALDRAAATPPGTVEVQVDGEWSFAQTLRHLVMATDVWLRRAILRIDQPFHPAGQPNEEYGAEGGDMSVFSHDRPTYQEVLAARADRVAQVQAFLAAATPEQLTEARVNPWAPQYPETVLSCLHTILGEEWEHLRYATRDLDLIEARAASHA